MSANQKFISRARASGCLLALATANPVFAQSETDDGSPRGISATIVERSPFVPSQFDPAPARPNAARPARPQRREEYEFRGVYEINGDYRLLISEARSRSGRWLSVGGTHENIEVSSYDSSNETVTLTIDGETRELQLASMESNPTPQPVSVQPVAQRPTARPAAQPATPGTPVRRTIQPSQNRAAPPPPPAWLKELRERAAERRAAGGGNVPPGPGSLPTNADGSPAFSPQDLPPPPGPPPDFIPELPANLPPPPPFPETLLNGD